MKKSCNNIKVVQLKKDYAMKAAPTIGCRCSSVVEHVIGNESAQASFIPFIQHITKSVYTTLSPGKVFLRRCYSKFRIFSIVRFCAMVSDISNGRFGGV